MLNRNHIILAILAAAGIAALTFTPVAGSGQGNRPMKLEGAWVGTTPDVGRTTWVFSSSDASGRRASCVVHAAAMAPAFLAILGADSVGDFPAELVMTGKNTGIVSEVAYATAAGTVVWIAVINGTFEFIDPSHIRLDQCTALYPAAADSDGDGLPDPGSAATWIIPMTTYGTRVPPPAPCPE